MIEIRASEKQKAAWLAAETLPVLTMINDGIMKGYEDSKFSLIADVLIMGDGDFERLEEKRAHPVSHLSVIDFVKMNCVSSCLGRKLIVLRDGKDGEIKMKTGDALDHRMIDHLSAIGARPDPTAVTIRIAA